MRTTESLKLLKVLIIDDEPFIRKGLGAIIDWEREGCVIAGEASNGLAGLEMIKKEYYDIIITDIKMPEMEGTELIRTVKENRISHGRFVILSGYYDFQYAKTAIQCGCMDYILKPIQKDELLGTIRKMVSHHQSEMGKKYNKQELEKAYLDRQLTAIVWGKHDTTNCTYVKETLRLSDKMSYLHLELSMQDSRFTSLSEELRRSMQRKLYHYARILLKSESDYVIFDIMKQTVCYDIGILCCSFMWEEMGLSQEEWINQLEQDLSERLGYEVMTCQGSKVDSLSQLYRSFRETVVLRTMSIYKKNAKSHLSSGESQFKCQKDDNFRRLLDQLIHGIEINDKMKIKEFAGAIYRHMIAKDVTPEIVGKNIQFLMYRLLGLAYDQDAEINQEEIIQYIRQTVFASQSNQGNERQFQRFIEEYSEFLTQLRQNSAKGTMELIEREIEENYMENISLKSLGEKFFINSAYLGQVFKKQYGCNFKDYLNNIRIKKAAEMINATDSLVYEIAMNVGYKNQEYFVTRFEEVYGMTPTRFRKRNRQSVGS